jgi:hypothetical protein
MGLAPVIIIIIIIIIIIFNNNTEGREADHSPASSAEVKNGGAMPPLPHMASWHST